MIGLVQYYSLQGSYFMNQYLRGQTSYIYRNEYLENLISEMWKLIISTKEFEKKYILYRFVQSDDYLQHLKVGDEYVEKGFTSTTRDPFYQPEGYKFGSILIKIKLPANIKGSALCIETVSYFPKEEEIILPPNTRMKLINKDENCIYYHIDKNIGKTVRTKYEFEIVGHSEISFPERPTYPSDRLTSTAIDFLQIPKTESITVTEKINRFINKYVNQMGQFTTTIGSKQVIVKSEWYDSTGVYKDFYANTSKNGYSMYSIFNNHILFIIELEGDSGIPRMYVNYHIKYSTLDRDDVFGIENFLKFIASVAYYFDIPNIVFYTDYISCDYLKPIDEEMKYIKHFGGTYCVDFYNYLKNGKKKYIDIGIVNTEITPKFRYHQLDLLKKISPETILKRKNEKGKDSMLYQIYVRTYRDTIPEINNNLANFYVWIVENQCFMLDELIFELCKIPQYKNDNPFRDDYYIFNAIAYLSNRNKDITYPLSINELNIDNLKVKIKSESMNRYRLMEEQRRR